MCISPLSIMINSCCCALMVLFVGSTYAYVIESDDSGNGSTDPPFVLSLPFYNNRFVRATKFPRIGRSPSDSDDLPPIIDINSNLNTEDNREHESQWFEQRSVLFPRIGKRAFHNRLGTTSLSNPYRMIDAQNRVHVNNSDDDRIHLKPFQSMLHYRDKRSISM